MWRLDMVTRLSTGWARLHEQRYAPVEMKHNWAYTTLAGGEPDWVVEHARKTRHDALLRARRDLEMRLARVREKERRQKQRYEDGEPSRKRFVSR